MTIVCNNKETKRRPVLETKKRISVLAFFIEVAISQIFPLNCLANLCNLY